MRYLATEYDFKISDIRKWGTLMIAIINAVPRVRAYGALEQDDAIKSCPFHVEMYISILTSSASA